MATISGTGGVDVLEGHQSDDILDGGNGNDFIDGGAGDDLLIGGRGGDVLFGGPGADTLIGGPGDDSFSDYGGSGLILGGSGNDVVGTQRARLDDQTHLVIRTGADDDTVFHDSVSPAATAAIRLGAGDDVIRLYANKGRVVVDLGTGHDTIHIASRYGGGDGPVIIKGFTAGTGGDTLDLTSPGALTDGGLTGFDGDLFGDGYARLVQKGSATLFQIDGSGGGDNFHTVLILRDVNAGDLVAANLDGFVP